MGKLILYAVNTATQTVSSGENVDFGSAVKKNCSCSSVNGAITLANNGVDYLMETTLVISMGAAGPITVQISKDGTAIPGAFATYTAGASGGYITVTIPAYIRNYCPRSGNNVITMTITGEDVTVSNVSTIVGTA